MTELSKEFIGKVFKEKDFNRELYDEEPKFLIVDGVGYAHLMQSFRESVGIETHIVKRITEFAGLIVVRVGGIRNHFRIGR